VLSAFLSLLRYCCITSLLPRHYLTVTLLSQRGDFAGITQLLKGGKKFAE